MREHKFKIISFTVIIISLIIVVQYFDQDHVSSFSKYYSQKPKNDKVAKEKSKTASDVDLARGIATEENDSSNRSKITTPPRPRPFMKPAQVVSKNSNSFEISREFRGESINSDLFVIENHYALDKDDFMPGDFEVIAQRGTFLIVKSDYPPTNALPIVLREGSTFPGILTGIVTLKFFNYNVGLDELYNKGFDITQEYEHLNTAFIKVNGVKAAQETYKYFKGHPNIETVELEILKGLRGHK